MTPDQLDQIIEEVPKTITELLGELHPKILEAARATLEESQDSETGKANVKITLGLTIDLVCAPVAWHVEAAVGVRYKAKSKPEVTDEPELELDVERGRKPRA